MKEQQLAQRIEDEREKRIRDEREAFESSKVCLPLHSQLHSDAIIYHLCVYQLCR